MKIGLVGLGISNLGILHLYQNVKDVKITVRSRKNITLPDGLRSRVERILLGEGYLDGIDEDILYLSPSVRRDAPPLREALHRGVLLSSDAEEFFGRVEGKVFAVTGSDGKSTTASLCGAILSESGRFPSVSVAGNIGKSLVLELIEGGRERAYVTELSSFQLSYMKPRTRRAVITNLSPNHLDWHRDYREYAEAKRNLLFHAEEPILNLDCPSLLPLYENIHPYAVFSTALSQGEMAKSGAEVTVGIEDGYVVRCGVRLLPCELLSHLAEYNRRNFLAAMCLADGFYTPDTLTSVLKGFRTMPHRAEYVGCISGVRFVDSSIDSTPMRTVTTLGAFPRGVILLLGGRGKGVPYRPLAEPIARTCRAVLLFGENRYEIEGDLLREDAFANCGVPLLHEGTLHDAVRRAYSIAHAGDTVLLSPASTSFDAFQNFEERGECFRRAFQALKNQEKGNKNL